MPVVCAATIWAMKMMTHKARWNRILGTELSRALHSPIENQHLAFGVRQAWWPMSESFRPQSRLFGRSWDLLGNLLREANNSLCFQLSACTHGFSRPLVNGLV